MILILLCRVYTCRFNNQVPNGKLVKSTFLLSSSRNILFVKKIENLLHTTSKKLSFKTWKAVFTNVRLKTANCKRGISYVEVAAPD